MVQLTETQKTILRTLIDLYEEKDRKGMVKSREVAQALGKDEGTVRNVIMWLKSMGLVESRTGPAGGYVPTLKAYEVIGKTSPLGVGIGIGSGHLVYEVEGKEYRLPAIHMEILNIFEASMPRAVIRVGGDVSKLRPGMRVRVESHPSSRLTVEGRVIRVNPQASEILLEVEKFVVIPDEIVGKVATRTLYKLREEMTVREAAKSLYERKIRGAPVVDKKGRVVGFLTTTDIAMIVGLGEDLDKPISNYMRRNVFTIGENDTIIEAMKLMDFYGVGRLLVVNSAGDPVGIVTRTDILRFIVAQQRPSRRS